MLTQSLGRQHEIRLDQLYFLRLDLREQCFFPQAFSIVWNLIRTQLVWRDCLTSLSVYFLPDIFQIAK